MATPHKGGAVTPAVTHAVVGGNPNTSQLLLVGTGPVSTPVSTNMANITVRVCTAYGATMTGDGSTVVTVALKTDAGNNSASGLTGTTTATASSGIATFSGLQVTNKGKYRFLFTAPGCVSVESPGFQIT